jgi:hypothetical protein
VKSGPQRYPGASTAYWYQTQYGGDAMESNVIVWHTTEGTSLPDYSGGSVAPNFTARPNFAAKRLEWFQHFDFDVSSRALVNKAGGVETNTLNVCQIEIVGTCDPGTHSRWANAGYSHLYTPELPDWVIRDLAAFTKWAHDNHGVPLSSGLTFKAYPSSYGANGVRMSFDNWNAFKGHCGHQHVPENDHGDPGAFPITAILDAAKGGTIPSQEDDMPTANEVAKAVLTYDGVIAVPGAPTTNPTWTLSSVQTEILKRLDKANVTLAAQKATIDELVKAVATLAAGVGNLDPAAIVRELTAAIESIDIHLDVPNT